jgi:ribosomal protein S18 acetylase RimI-like enzyme
METIIGLGVSPWPNFKRYRMERPTLGISPPVVIPGVEFVPFRPEILAEHAEALSQSFAESDDRMIFPVLSGFAGCLELLREIARRRDFVHEATWLARSSSGPVGTVQGLWNGSIGLVQNVGVLPHLRGRGIGRALLTLATLGYASVDVETIQLEVTAANEAAVNLYQSMGFKRSKVIYKPVITLSV